MPIFCQCGGGAGAAVWEIADRRSDHAIAQQVSKSTPSLGGGGTDSGWNQDENRFMAASRDDEVFARSG